MKHRHIFVPPFWKYNRFCLLCGRLESLTVGNNTIRLGDEKIVFGGSTTLDSSKQLGFDGSSKLIYRDDVGVKTVATSDQTSSVVKVAEWSTSSSTSITGTTETTITSQSLSLDFNTYKYFVFEIIPRDTSHNYSISSSGAATFTLRLYSLVGSGSTVSVVWDIGSSGLLTCYGYVYVLYHKFTTDINNPYLVRIFAEDKIGTDYTLISSANRYTVAAGFNANMLASSTPPNQFKLTGAWSTSGSFTFTASVYRVYGYRD